METNPKGCVGYFIAPKNIHFHNYKLPWYLQGCTTLVEGVSTGNAWVREYVLYLINIQNSISYSFYKIIFYIPQVEVWSANQ
jgi:hypothetical protein